MRLIVVVCTIACSALICVPDGQAQVIADLAADFSSTVNSGTSAWSFRYRPDNNRNGNYPLLPTFGPAVGSWSPSNPGAWTQPGPNLPEIGVNRTGVTVTNTTASPQDSFPVVDGTFWLRPGTGQIAVVSWLFRFVDPKLILFEVTDGGLGTPGGDGAMLYYENRHSDGTQFGSSSSGGISSTGTGTLTGLYIQMMGPGDRANFIVDPQANAAFDSLSMKIVVSVVPEPHGLISGLLAAAGVVLIFKSRSKQNVSGAAVE